jgi:hypothetical protein
LGQCEQDTGWLRVTVAYTTNHGNWVFAFEFIQIGHCVLMMCFRKDKEKKGSWMGRRGWRETTRELEITGLIHSKQNKPDVSSLAKKFKIK